ncbi:molybdenum cofactor biosynthesis protein MoaE [Bythopirellula polymerisocia]|uniref:Molybdopterin synthase catalytic subunit n=1 Tax=Bythopirellula polymerisocia TaxID=2528003 RepID=A0A5C6CQ88_9BACT|nr:molybdenum cofactor biosynthesis protein MoaE [Bythopirellula polymerisocia]TWU25664.1 Molybdopterin synthase catalytic subunit [Bythopirellula polymerisocia]
MIQLTTFPIDSDALVRQAQVPASGAVLLFLGVTRQHTSGRETAELRYDAYHEMAEKELAALEEKARQKWHLNECLIVHRLGKVPLGEASVAIVVASPHRHAAFAAGEWLIDTLKMSVPIWKEEHWADGSSDWIHPEHDVKHSQATSTNK